MESSVKASWWMWWGNPLVQIHPDKKKLFYVDQPGYEELDYSGIESLRATLGLKLVPEKGIVSAPFYGMIAMFEPQDLLESQQKLPALTFDESVLKFSLSEWEQQFQIQNKDHVRALITFSRSLPEDVQPLVKKIVVACVGFPSGDRAPLSLVERAQVVLSVFFGHRFPEFSKRWFLGLPDTVMHVVDQVGEVDPEILERFCTLIDPEVQALIQQINQRYTVPELDFKTLADYETDV